MREQLQEKSNQIDAYLVCGRKSVYTQLWALLARPTLAVRSGGL